MSRSLAQDISSAINCHSAENGSNTPDFILGEFLITVLEAWDTACKRRDEWYGVTHEPVEGWTETVKQLKKENETDV